MFLSIGSSYICRSWLADRTRWQRLQWCPTWQRHELRNKYSREIFNKNIWLFIYWKYRLIRFEMISVTTTFYIFFKSHCGTRAKYDTCYGMKFQEALTNIILKFSEESRIFSSFQYFLQNGTSLNITNYLF